MFWELAAVGVVGLLIAGFGAWALRGIRKGHEAQPKLDIEEARNAALQDQIEQGRGPTVTRRDFRKWLRKTSNRV